MKNIVIAGTYVEVTDDTYKKIEALLVLDKLKPKFKPVTVHGLTIGEDSVHVWIKSDMDRGHECFQSLDNARETAKALLDAAAHIEANK